MTAQSNNHHRCRFATASGRRCRRNISDRYSGLCDRHASPSLDTGVGPDIDTQDLTAAFKVSRADLKTAQQINDFLATLATLLIQNRVSARRASVLAYTASLILRTLPLIERELAPAANHLAGHIVLDVPRPDRSIPSTGYSAPDISPAPFAAASSQKLESSATPTQSDISNLTTPQSPTLPHRSRSERGSEHTKSTALEPPNTLLPAHLLTG